MSKLLVVKDEKGLVRDSFSKAILVTDSQALLEHRKRKAAASTQLDTQSRILKLESQVAELISVLNKYITKDTK